MNAITSLNKLFGETHEEFRATNGWKNESSIWKHLKLHGRPRKLSQWGFKLENDTPGKVVKIL